MKKVSTLIIILCASVIVSAQSFKDHFFSSIGFSPFLDFGSGPSQVEGPFADQNNNGNPVYLVYQSNWSFSPTFVYEARYNLTEPSENMAISVKSTPALTGWAGEGLFGFFLPIGIGLELGNGATYQTSANTGYSFTLGYSLNMTPLLLMGSVPDEADLYNVDINSTWGCPYIAAGIRYWNKKNKLREISIRYGFGPSGDSDSAVGNRSSSSVSDVKGSYILRVSWMKYINY
jgi:hypothetical protein